jgi:5,10-methylenetetrahydrofolate reductase
VNGRADFRIVCEVEPPSRPDLRHLHDQVAALAGVATDFLVPDNHIGRATVSSLAVADEVQRRGARAIACLNCRDRNVLGLHRDLLTAATYGIERLLCVYGDDPRHGTRATDLTTRTMVDAIRAYDDSPALAGHPPFELGVATALNPVPGWKRDADFVFTQVSFALADLFRWRDATALNAPVYAGVMVLQSARTAAAVPGIAVPDDLLARVRADPRAGVDAACAATAAIHAHGGFAGVHLVALGRYREMAARLPYAQAQCVS